MANKPFHYQEPFPLGPDTTEYQLLTKDYVKVENWNGHEMLVVDPEALTILSNAASHNNSFMLRREHNQMVAKILSDPEASENDKFVLRWLLKACFRSAKTQAQLSLPHTKDNKFGPDATTKKRFLSVSTRLTPKTIFATRKMHLSTCMTRSTQDATFLLKSKFTLKKATSINSYL